MYSEVREYLEPFFVVLNLNMIGIGKFEITLVFSHHFVPTNGYKYQPNSLLDQFFLLHEP